MTRTSDLCSSSFFLPLSGVVDVVKAIVFPFGDQTIDSTAVSSPVSARGSPPLRERRWICAGAGLPSFGSPARRKASERPSGDQRGIVSRGPFVMRRGVAPARVSTLHRDRKSVVAGKSGDSGG